MPIQLQTHSDGETEAERLALGEPLGDSEGETEGEAEGLAEGVAEGEADGLDTSSVIPPQICGCSNIANGSR